MQVEGYHGTTEASATALLGGSPWRPSISEGDWLGFGSYFFQDGPERAHHWASVACEGTANVPVVLRAKLDLSDCLDLLDLSDFALLKSVVATIPPNRLPEQEELIVRQGRARPPRPGTPLHMRNKLDRYAIDWCVAELEETRKISAVRSAFLWGHAIHQQSCIFNWSRVEIAIRDPAAILSIERVGTI